MSEEYPRTLAEVERRFSDDAACRQYLFELRWPTGFRCPRCGHEDAWPISRGLWLCGGCRMQVSVPAGTVFQDTHLPLTVWFRAMWHITSQKSGVSALGLQRALGLGSYKTAWLILHKLRQAMVRPGRERLRGVVEVDETCWGAAESGGSNRPFGLQQGAHCRRCRAGWQRHRAHSHGTNPRFRSRNPSWLYPIVGRTRKHSLHRWAQFLPRDERLYPPTARPAPPQGWGTLTAQSPPSGLSAQAMDARNPSGSYRYQHLDDYLNEFVFRFNRRRSASRGKLFFRLAQHALQIAPTTYERLVRPQDVE